MQKQSQSPQGRCHIPSNFQNQSEYCDNIQPQNARVQPASRGNIMNRAAIFEQSCQPINNIPENHPSRNARNISPGLQSRAAAFNNPQCQPNQQQTTEVRRRTVSPQITSKQQMYSQNQINQNKSQCIPSEVRNVSTNMIQNINKMDNQFIGRQHVSDGFTNEHLHKYFYGPSTAQKPQSPRTQQCVSPQSPRVQQPIYSQPPQMQQPVCPQSPRTQQSVYSPSIQSQSMQAQYMPSQHIEGNQIVKDSIITKSCSESQNEKQFFKSSATNQDNNFYNNYQIQAFLQRIVLIQNHLRITIEAGEVAYEACIMELIRDQFGELINGDIQLLEPEQYKAVDILSNYSEDECSGDRADMISSYNEYKSIFTQMDRSMPPLKYPDEKPCQTSPEMMSFDRMTSLYNGLKLGYSIILDKFEMFSTKFQLENLFNSLFDKHIFALNTEWYDENILTRGTVIHFMYRISKLLKYLSFFMNKSQLEHEDVIFNTISEKLNFTNDVEVDQEFLDAFQQPPTECRNTLYDLIGDGIDITVKKPTNDNPDYMCYDKMKYLYEGFEAAFWMICDEFERKVYPAYQIIDAINSSLQFKFDVFTQPPGRSLCRERDPNRGVPLQKAIQRMVIFLGILRKELEDGKLIKTNIYEWLKTNLLVNKCSSPLDLYLCKGLFIYKPENSAETEINRLLPTLNLPNSQSIPLAESDEVYFSDALRFYLKIQGGVLRFLRFLDMDLFANAIENQSWVDNRLRESQIRYVFKNEGVNAPSNEIDGNPIIRLDPMPDDYDTPEYLTHLGL